MSNIILSFPQVGTGAFALPTKYAEWNTVEQKTAAFVGSGYVAQAPYPIWHFSFPVPYLRGRIDQPGTAVAIMFDVLFGVAGRADTFLFFDPNDNAVHLGQFGTGDGTTTAFQITRPINNNPNRRDIVQNFVGNPQIFINGTLQTSGYSIDNFGVITFTSAPAANAVLAWSGQFYFRCRFDEDAIESFQMIAPDTWACDGLKWTTYILGN